MNIKSASWIASLIFVEKKRFRPLVSMTTSYSPGLKKQEKKLGIKQYNDCVYYIYI